MVDRFTLRAEKRTLELLLLLRRDENLRNSDTLRTARRKRLAGTFAITHTGERGKSGDGLTRARVRWHGRVLRSLGIDDEGSRGGLRKERDKRRDSTLRESRAAPSRRHVAPPDSSRTPRNYPHHRRKPGCTSARNRPKATGFVGTTEPAPPATRKIPTLPCDATLFSRTNFRSLSATD